MYRSASASPTGRDLAFAVTLAALLALGVLGVLLLNTSMQQQSRAISAAHERMAALAQQAQVLSSRLDVASDPWRLAERARELRLRPAENVEYLRVMPTDRKRSARQEKSAHADRKLGKTAKVHPAVPFHLSGQ